MKSREDLLIRASRRIAKVAHKAKMGTATKQDALLLQDGEAVLQRLFPSLNKKDTLQLANYIVDISGWSLRHLLNMKLPETVVVLKNKNIESLLNAPWDTKVFDEDNRAYPLYKVGRIATHERSLTAVEIYRVLAKRKLEFRTHDEDPIKAFEEALKKAPGLRHFKTIDGIKFRPIGKKGSRERRRPVYRRG